jgi:hypothetical protein
MKYRSGSFRSGLELVRIGNEEKRIMICRRAASVTGLAIPLSIAAILLAGPLLAQVPLTSGVAQPTSINAYYICTAIPPSYCIAWGGTFYIDVPANATQLTLTVQQNPGGPQLYIYGRYGALPTVVGSTVVSDMVAVAGVTASLSRNTGLQTGRYYFQAAVRIYAPQTVTVSGSLTVTLQTTAPTYTISGTVRDASSNPVSGVQMNLTGGATSSVATSSAGSYSFPSLTSGLSYTVTPSKPGCTFSPPSRTLTLNSDQSGQDFTASCPPTTYTISGQIRDASNNPVSGVLVTLSGGMSTSATTNSSGDYTLSNLTAGLNYTVTPSKAGYSFTPQTRSYTSLSSDQPAQNFTALANSSGTYNGAWSGLTSQGRPISFTVSNNTITQIVYSVGWSAGAGCPTSSTTTANVNIPITNGSFFSTNFSGSFSSPSSASGTLQAVLNIPPPQNCFQTFNLTWNASLDSAPCTYSISPTSNTLPAVGGAGSISLTTQPGCAWTASTNAGWITLLNFPSGSGPATMQYVVSVNTGPQRTGTITFGGQTFTLTQQAASCVYSITPLSASIGSSGGNQTVTVQTNFGCAWTVSSPPSWVTISNGASGTGNGTVVLSVAPNPGSSPRMTTLTIAGQSFSLTQSGASCTFSLSETVLNMPSSGGTASVNLGTGAGCNWEISQSESWVSASATAGAGPATLQFTVAANSSANPRSVVLTIAGLSLTINQSGATCGYVLSASSATLPAGGGSVDVVLTAGSTCSWSVSNANSWLTVSPSSGVGGATIHISAPANPSASSRAGTISIAGQSYTVTQAGASLPPAPLTQPTRFGALEPCRLVETRPEYNFEGRTGAFGPPFLSAGETRTFVPSASSVCRKVPASALAFVLNVTLIPRGPVDFVTVFPAGEPRPDFYTVTSRDGQIVANSAIVRAGAGGAISIYASHATDVVIDIAGFFTDNPAVANLAFYPVTPCRVIETRAEYRQPPGPFGPNGMNARETRSFRFPGNGYCPVPSSAAAYSVTITVVPPGPLAFLTAWPTGLPQPNVSSMNSPAGRVVANSVIVPASPDGSINLYTYDRSDVIVDINGYFAADDNVSGLYYFPVTQCRVSNTMDNSLTGSFGAPAFASETARTIPILASSRCTGIPSNAKAYALNAVVQPNGSPMPFLTVWPTGQQRPNASVINAFQGQSVSSGFIVPAGVGGSVDVFAYRATHVILEIAGFFGR